MIPIRSIRRVSFKSLAFLLAWCVITPVPFVRAEEAVTPTVTTQEAALLGEVEDLRPTDPTAALDRLTARTRPDSSAALPFAAGNLHFEQGRRDEAVEAYRDALERFPRFRLAAVNLARVLLTREDPKPAAEILTRFVGAALADADVYLLLGHARLQQAQPASAETAFRQALLLRPAHHDARMGLAWALIEQERAIEAAALLRELTLEDPASKEHWRLRAGASLQAGQTERALVEIETARRLGHADDGLLLALGDLYLARGQSADAVAVFEDALAERPEDPEPALHAARGLLYLGEADRADAMLARIEHLDLTPGQRKARLEVRAHAAQIREEPEQARTAWKELLKESPTHGPAMMALGDLDRVAGARDDADLWYERAMRVPGYESQARIRRAQLAAEDGRYERAIEHLETALVHERRPDVERYLDQIRRLAELHTDRATP